MKKKRKLLLIDDQEKELENLEVEDIEIDEKYLLKISKENYDNEEPCIIIRTTIAADLYMEFNKYLYKEIEKGNSKITISNLQEPFCECFSIRKDAKFIIVE